MDTAFCPVQPNLLSELAGHELTILITHEVVVTKYLGNILHTFTELDVVHGVGAKRIGDKIHVSHRAGGANTFLTEGCTGGLTLEGSSLHQDTILPVRGLFNRNGDVTVASTIENTFNLYAVLGFEASFVDVVEVVKAHGVTCVTMSNANFVAICVLHALLPFAKVVAAFFRSINTHTKPVRLVVLATKNVGEDNFLVDHQVLENNGVILLIDVLDDTEHTKLDVNSTEFAVDVSEICNVITNDLLAGNHCSGGLTTCGGVCTTEVSLAIFLLVYCSHDKHVLTKPTFLAALIDCKTHGVLLQTNGVTSILVVHGVYNVVLGIHVDSAVLQVYGTTILIKLTSGVDEAEEIILLIVLHVEEVAVCSAVQDVLGVSNVPAIGELHARNGERTLGRAFRVEQHNCVLALHDALGNAHDLTEAFFILDGVEGSHLIHVLFVDHETGVLLVASLVAITVPVDGLLGVCKSVLLAFSQGLVSYILGVFFTVITYIDGFGITVLSEGSNEVHHLVIFQGCKLLETLFTHLFF